MNKQGHLQKMRTVIFDCDDDPHIIATMLKPPKKPENRNIWDSLPLEEKQITRRSAVTNSPQGLSIYRDMEELEANAIDDYLTSMNDESDFDEEEFARLLDLDEVKNNNEKNIDRCTHKFIKGDRKGEICGRRANHGEGINMRCSKHRYCKIKEDEIINQDEIINILPPNRGRGRPETCETKIKKAMNELTEEQKKKFTVIACLLIKHMSGGN